MDIIDKPSLMEPLLPAEGNRVIEDLSYDLTAKAAALKAILPKETTIAVGNLVRAMNCYYSNLIEGHNTHPIDIERALKKDYTSDPIRRNLQLEATAHIELQETIDTKPLTYPISSSAFICWLHSEFCRKLPEALLMSDGLESRKSIPVVPGAFRNVEVIVGEHIAPTAQSLPKFMQLFESGYRLENLSKSRRIVAAAAAHHRLLWIHPFLDGNGRVARLHSHAYLKEIGVGSSIWSVSRGLARNVAEYKQKLAIADEWRRGDLDGRGNLTEEGLVDFCAFFLKICIDQVEFMGKLLETSKLVDRIQSFCDQETKAKRLPSGAFFVLREVVNSGELPRGKASDVTGYKERNARSIVKALLDRGLLTSESPRGHLRLGIPFEVVDAWFPRLYPADLTSN